MGTLFIVSTPIGNLEDISIRALKTLFSVSSIACEDTRVTGNLLELVKNRYGKEFSLGDKPKLIAYHDANEQNVTPELIGLLEAGSTVALVSDAGTPLVSDPGFRIVQEVLKRKIPIVIIPGTSAFLTALTGSGLPAHTFTFLGYLPEKQTNRMELLDRIKKSSAIFPSTYIRYVAPHKLQQTLEDMEFIYEKIEIHVARELTKLHEEYWKGTIAEARNYFEHPKGEFVLLFTLKG
jgi:16S rRNA (cytidine1402-2'-O)-methyltransferase